MHALCDRLRPRHTHTSRSLHVVRARNPRGKLVTAVTGLAEAACVSRAANADIMQSSQDHGSAGAMAGSTPEPDGDSNVSPPLLCATAGCALAKPTLCLALRHTLVPAIAVDICHPVSLPEL